MRYYSGRLHKQCTGNKTALIVVTIGASTVECVLLNACYSDVQAEAIRQHIDYVIGMSQDIAANLSNAATTRTL